VFAQIASIQKNGLLLHRLGARRGRRTHQLHAASKRLCDGPSSGLQTRPSGLHIHENHRRGARGACSIGSSSIVIFVNIVLFFIISSSINDIFGFFFLFFFLLLRFCT